MGAGKTAETTESKGLSETIARSESGAVIPRSASISELGESTAASSRSGSTPEKQDSTFETDKTGEMVQTSSTRKLGENNILDDTTTPTDTLTTT